jgi:hypothetical protein
MAKNGEPKKVEPKKPRPLRNVPRKRARELVAERMKMVETTVFGPYTLTSIMCDFNGDQIHGFGVARKSFGDKNNVETGLNVAKAEAVQSIVTKAKGRFPHPFSRA